MAKQVQQQTVSELIELSRLLGEFGQIRRITLLPNGEPETDSHHSFSLALIAFELASQYAPELDVKKILLYSLVHDLPELITGDVNTLNASSEQLVAKSEQDKLALQEVKKVLADAPHIIVAIEAYEAMNDQEALFVYWIDKLSTIPTHFYDDGANLRARGINNQQDIQRWYERTLQKLQRQGGTPHASAVEVLELAYWKMHDELLG
jgi:5'-deoxynucleotidase YfbR-like HD superfamily hydrolase